MRLTLAMGALLLLACPVSAQNGTPDGTQNGAMGPARSPVAFPQVTGVPVPLESVSGGSVPSIHSTSLTAHIIK